MNAHPWKATVGFCLLMVLAPGAVAQTVVYDNTTTYTGAEFPGGPLDRGNEITLAGTARTVTGIGIDLRLDGDGSATFDAAVNFHKNDFPFGGLNRPGTLLWGTGWVPLTIDGGAPVFFQFDVPDVTVPDTFTWTIWLSNQQGSTAPLGVSQFDPPTIGSVRPGVWVPVGGAQMWELVDLEQPPFGARITAVPPIPTVSQWGLLLTGLALLAMGTAVIRRRHLEQQLAGGPSLHARVAGGMGAFFGVMACTSYASAQVQVGPQIRIDVGGGTFAANETSIASSDFAPNEIVAAWNDWRESPPGLEFIRIGVGVSTDGGATWNDSLLAPPSEIVSYGEFDPMTAYDDRTGTLWAGGIITGFVGGQSQRNEPLHCV